MCDWRYCSNAIDTNGTNQHDIIIYAYFILEWLVYPAWKRSKISEVHSNKLSKHSQARNNNHPIRCMYAWWVYNTSHVGVGDVETPCSDHTPPYCFYTAAFIHYLLYSCSHNPALQWIASYNPCTWIETLSNRYSVKCYFFTWSNMLFIKSLNKK